MKQDQDITIEEKLLKTYQAFYDQDTGFYALRHKIREMIKSDISALYQNNTNKISKTYHISPEDAKRKQLELIYFGVFRVICDLENNGGLDKKAQTLSKTEETILKAAIIEKTKLILTEISKFFQDSKNLKNKTVDDLERTINKKAKLANDRIRFAFTPEQIQKYHFGYGCNHTTIAFINTNQSLTPEYRIPIKDIKLIITTRWDHLHDGSDGHVVPCVKMQDGTYYAFEPQIIPQKGKIEFITLGQSEKPQGQTIFHLLRHGAGAPYMITTNFISPDDYMTHFGNSKKFREQYSKVNRSNAFAFLKQQIDLGNLSQEVVKKYKKEYDKYHTEKLRAAAQEKQAAKQLKPEPNRSK